MKKSILSIALFLASVTPAFAQFTVEAAAIPAVSVGCVYQVTVVSPLTIVCSTAGSGTVTSTGTLTAGVLAKWSSSGVLANSIISEASTTATVAGTLTATILQISGASINTIGTLGNVCYLTTACTLTGTNFTGIPAAAILAGTFGSGTYAITGNLELGHASDTTIARVSAGLVSVEGNTLAMLATANVFTAAQTITASTVPNLTIRNVATDGTTKFGMITGTSYTTAEEPVTLMEYRVDGVGNYVRIGGGRSEGNTASEIQFYTDPTLNTVGGTLRMSITDVRTAVTGNLTVSGTATIPTVSVTGAGVNGLNLTSTQPLFYMSETDQGSNAKTWDIVASGSILSFRVVNDAYSAATDYFTITRSGATPTLITIGAPLQLTNGTAAVSMTAIQTDAGTGGVELDFFHNSASPAASDDVARLFFNGNDGAGNKTRYARINGTVLDTTNTSEDGRLGIDVMTAGSEITVATFSGSGGVTISSSAGGLQMGTWPTTGSAANAVVSDGNFLSRSTSSVRYKTDVSQVLTEQARSIVMGLQPVTYRGLAAQDGPRRWVGLIAEDVAKVDPLLVTFDDQRRPDYVTYDRVAVYSIAMAQDHERRLSAIEARLGIPGPTSEAPAAVASRISTAAQAINTTADTLKVRNDSRRLADAAEAARSKDLARAERDKAQRDAEREKKAADLEVVTRRQFAIRQSVAQCEADNVIIIQQGGRPVVCASSTEEKAEAKLLQDERNAAATKQAEQRKADMVACAARNQLIVKQGGRPVACGVQ